jgi:arabinogalactan endo-1,4-beta-galactosidase
MPLNPELGLWAAYGDASTYQQPPDFASYPEIKLPGPWLSLNIHQMARAMHEYGKLVARQILRTGVRVNHWDLGNEVEYGIAGVAVQPLFPDSTYEPPDEIDPAIGQMSVGKLLNMSDADRIAWFNAHLWPHVGRLLAAVAAGIRKVDRKARFSTHISGVGAKTPRTWTAFWKAMKAQGYLPDQFGTSFYPTAPPPLGASDPVATVKDAARQLHRRYGRRTMIAESGYPSGRMPPPYVYDTPVPGYPLDESGQARFLRDFCAAGMNQRWLAGMRPWAPDLCSPDSWGPMSFFDLSGKRATGKPALRSIPKAVRDSLGCEDPR